MASNYFSKNILFPTKQNLTIFIRFCQINLYSAMWESKLWYNSQNTNLWNSYKITGKYCMLPTKYVLKIILKLDLFLLPWHWHRHWLGASPLECVPHSTAAPPFLASCNRWKKTEESWLDLNILRNLCHNISVNNMWIGNNTPSIHFSPTIWNNNNNNKNSKYGKRNLCNLSY